jgi:cytochrome c peroxidase
MRRKSAILTLLGAMVLILAAAMPFALANSRAGWTPEERDVLRSMSLSSLGTVPADPSNRVADDPRAALLGRSLFFDERLSGNGRVSCATCHLPEQDFQDGKPLGEGVALAARRTMPIAGTAHSPWMFWDGRSDTQWGQALGPLESPVEHGGSRTRYVHSVAAHYRDEYEAIFGRLPDISGLPQDAGPVADRAWQAAWDGIPPARQEQISAVFANIGKAIAAYERQIGFAPSRFDLYVEAEVAGKPHTPASALSRDEVAGLRLFIGKANCIDCHNGALLTDNHFHNTGVGLPATALPPDSGRIVGVREALAGEFSCTSRHSDAAADDCQELRFAVTGGHELIRAYKTPSLRNVAQRAPFMHAGQIATLAGVVAHYDRAPAAPFGHSELKPLRLSRDERRQIEAFLATLTGPLSAPPGFLEAPVAGRSDSR